MINDFKEIKNSIAHSIVLVNGLTISTRPIIYMFYYSINLLVGIIFILGNVVEVPGNKF